MNYESQRMRARRNSKKDLKKDFSWGLAFWELKSTGEDRAMFHIQLQKDMVNVYRICKRLGYFGVPWSSHLNWVNASL